MIVQPCSRAICAWSLFSSLKTLLLKNIHTVSSGMLRRTKLVALNCSKGTRILLHCTVTHMIEIRPDVSRRRWSSNAHISLGATWDQSLAASESTFSVLFLTPALNVEMMICFMWLRLLKPLERQKYNWVDWFPLSLLHYKRSISNRDRSISSDAVGWCGEIHLLLFNQESVWKKPQQGSSSRVPHRVVVSTFARFYWHLLLLMTTASLSSHSNKCARLKDGGWEISPATLQPCTPALHLSSS